MWNVNRGWNLVRVVAGYVLSRVWRRVFHWGDVVSLSIEPTNCCNLHCVECPSGLDLLTRERGIMDFELFKHIVDQISPTLLYLNLYFQGEPYLHPRFSEMVGYAKSRNIFVSSSTNGHFLTPETAKATIESGLDKLIISLDGTDAKAYQQYRVGGDFEKVIAGIREIIKQKELLSLNHRYGSKGSQNNKPRIILQFLYLKSNQHQIKEIKQLGKELGVDKVELKTAQFYNFADGNPLMPDEPRHSRYIKISGQKNGNPQYKIRNRLPNHCFRMWSSCVITWNGEVVPCCFDKDAKYLMGDLKNQSFSQIWQNSRYNEFRKKILFSRKSIDICRNCTEGTGSTFIF
jgi:radical SAM protein with 4Fe4S-binding SPASM domain